MPDLSDLDGAIPMPRRSGPQVLLVGLLDSLAMLREEITALLERVEREGVDPLLVLDRLDASYGEAAHVDLGRRRRNSNSCARDSRRLTTRRDGSNAARSTESWWQPPSMTYSGTRTTGALDARRVAQHTGDATERGRNCSPFSKSVEITPVSVPRWSASSIRWSMASSRSPSSASTVAPQREHSWSSVAALLLMRSDSSWPFSQV